MKVAILGGSFDPPHIGHYLLALQIKEQLAFDQIWFIPCFQHPFNKTLSQAKHRLAMTKLFENDWLKVSDYEMHNKRISYSIDTLHSLSDRYKKISFSWTIGSDQLADFPKWKKWEKVISDFGLTIFPRNLFTQDLEEKTTSSLHLKKLPTTIHIVHEKNIIQTTLSSSIIRQRIQEGKPITHMVPKKVEKYIIGHALYE